MTNNKQSSVEWFAKESWNLKVKLENKEISIGEYGVTYVDLLKQAKAMHKEEIGDAYFLGYEDHQTLDWHDLDEYYNETFNTHEKNNKN